MSAKGLLFVVSGPSGVGKGTILKLAQQNRNDICFSISATSRKPRNGEIDGKHYFFVEPDEFEKMIEEGKLIEWVKYCENFYGTPKEYINSKICEGKNVILEIEVEGALNIKKTYPESISILFIPPNFTELRNRLIQRGTETEEVIEKRINRAKQELQFASSYDYIIINDTINAAVNAFNCIIEAEQHKTSFYKNHINEMINE